MAATSSFGTQCAYAFVVFVCTHGQAGCEQLYMGLHTLNAVAHRSNVLGQGSVALALIAIDMLTTFYARPFVEGWRDVLVCGYASCITFGTPSINHFHPCWLRKSLTAW